MTRKTTTRLTLTVETIEETHLSSGPFRPSRQVIDTTGVEVRDSELPPSRPSGARPVARVVPLRRAG